MRAPMTATYPLWLIRRAAHGVGYVHSPSLALTSAIWADWPWRWCVSLAACLSIQRVACFGLHSEFLTPELAATSGGGWTLAAPQKWWGHKAEKATWFYIVGSDPGDLPALPIILGEAAYVVQSRKRQDYRPHITKAEREHTPPDLARWLVEVARRCAIDKRKAA